MHAVVRTYSGKGAKGLIDVIEKNKTEVEGLLQAINGFVSYYLGREPINLQGVRLARVRYAPIATKFCSTGEMW